MRIIREQEKSMICPFCNVFSYMSWEELIAFNDNFGVYAVKCAHCGKIALWKWIGDATRRNYERILIFPLESDAPRANPDMPDMFKELYGEAAKIKIFSPRGAAAILRLCLQKICAHLAGKDDTIANNLNSLGKSADPIPPRIMKAAQAVRVIGNEAVHPGVIDFSESNPDTDDTVNALFELINLIVDSQITQLKKIDSIIARQPSPVKDKILKSPGVKP